MRSLPAVPRESGADACAVKAYESRVACVAEAEREHAPIAVSAAGIETGYGRALLLSSPEDEPGSQMVMLLRKLLGLARFMGAPQRRRRRPQRRLDIRV
jgi:hypothetical protein